MSAPVARCPECAGPNGSHGYVHTRHGNGGGRNRRCSYYDGQRIEDLLELAQAHGRRFDGAVIRGDLAQMDVELDALREISKLLRIAVAAAA